MNRFKKNLMLLAVLTAFIFMFSLSALAAEEKSEGERICQAYEYNQAKTYAADGNYSGFNYVLSDNTAIITGYTGNSTSVTVPSAIKGYPVTGIGNGAFKNNSVIREINVCSSIETIGNEAFAGCELLNTAILTEGLIWIGGSSFNGCKNLKSITIPSTVEGIGDYAFYDCAKLEKVVIKASSDNKDSAYIGYRAFGNCSSLMYIYIPASYKEFRGDDIFINHSPSLTIWGVKGSEAESYANKLRILFNRLATPVLISASNTANGIKVTWKKVYGATSYQVYRKNGSGGFTPLKKVTDTIYTDTSTTSGKSYCYTVKALNSKSSSTYSKTGIKLVRLTAPVLSDVKNVKSGIKFSWKKVNGASGYYVYRKISRGTDWKRIKIVTGGSTTTWTDTSVSSGTGYVYTVKAFYDSFSSTYNTAGKGILRLSQPALLSVVNNTTGITISWKKVSGAAGYCIYRKSGSTSEWKKVKDIMKGTSLSWNDTSAVNGKKYIYTVKAYNKSAFSSYDEKGKTNVRLTTPVLSEATNSSPKKMTIIWKKNNSASGYQIRYRTGNVTKTTTVSGNSNVKKVVSGLTKGKTYTINIRSYKTLSNVKYYSTWSKSKTVKITK